MTVSFARAHRLTILDFYIYTRPGPDVTKRIEQAVSQLGTEYPNLHRDAYGVSGHGEAKCNLSTCNQCTSTIWIVLDTPCPCVKRA